MCVVIDVCVHVYNCGLSLCVCVCMYTIVDYPCVCVCEYVVCDTTVHVCVGLHCSLPLSLTPPLQNWKHWVMNTLVNWTRTLVSLTQQ